MMRTRLSVTTAVLALTSAAGAHASERLSYIHVGPAQLTLADKADIRLGGVTVPNASFSSKAQWTAVAEIGHMLSDHVSAAITLGVPPTAKAYGSGSINGIGKLGEATYGPMAATIKYHFDSVGPVRPYVGGGMSYMHIFNTKDGVMTGLKVQDTIGPAVQAGFDVALNEKFGVFVDYKKAWLRTDASGAIGAAPASARLVFDPSVINAGVSFKF